jgi:hypothetical protein
MMERGKPLLSRLDRRLWLSALLCVLLIGQAEASSIFSLNTTGEVIQPAEGRSRGMGGLAVGLFDNNTALINPGGLGWVDRMSFSVTYLPEIQRPKDESGDNRIGFSIFPHMSGVLPLPWGFTAGAELGLIRGFGFLSEADRSLPDVGAFHSKVTKVGGAYRFSVGLGRLATKRVSLGATYDTILGSSRESWIWEYSDESLADVNTRLQTIHSGNGFRFGTGIKTKPVDIGFFYKPAHTIYWNNRLYLEGEETLEGQSHYLRLTPRRLRYPWTAGIGLTHQPDSSLTIGVELIHSPTSKIEVDGTQSDMFADYLRLGFGIEYQGSRRSTSSLASRIAWRAGAYRQAWETKVLGETINENFLTFGLGLPVSAIEGSLNLTLEYGRRAADLLTGSDERSNASESIWRLSISLKGQERWRKRRSPWDGDDIDW